LMKWRINAHRINYRKERACEEKQHINSIFFRGGAGCVCVFEHV